MLGGDGRRQLTQPRPQGGQVGSPSGRWRRATWASGRARPGGGRTPSPLCHRQPPGGSQNTTKRRAAFRTLAADQSVTRRNRPRLSECGDTQGPQPDCGVRDSAATWQDVRVHPRSTITRRAVLRGLLGVTGAAAVSLTAGCDVFSPAPSGTETPDPLEPFLRETVALADLYDTVLLQVPALASVITVPRDTHRKHAQALATAIGASAPRASGTVGPSAAPGADRTAAIAALVAAETAARDAAIEACLAAPARVASLVGSMAAARATHLEVLR
jgi:hypothetical protein